ncbi:glycosyltransferase [Marinilabilia rubra]|uniref:Glycosyltransferase n=1 Tax=Marinilabilia rubra TaxID=2162893 RepID=A0A2U2B8N8_9BACT|nr:glycosyltransferase [Marinilabilia rubra]PWD99428.1 glycosyltransferase [Marinilabilia rubra]
MNIALINSIGKNKWGGGEKWMIMAAIGLKSLGHNVVVVSRKGSKLSAKAREENLDIKEIGANSDFDVVAGLQFCSFFRKFRPDVIIGCQNKDWRVAAVALKLAGSKAKVFSRQGLQLLKNHWWYKWTVKLFCDGIITNTNTIKKEYESFLPVDKDFIKVIFNGVEKGSDHLEKFDYSAYIPDDVSNPVIILSTGRLAHQKGFKFLIEAAEKIIKEHPNVYFFLAGRGKLETSLKHQIDRLGITKHFVLLGFVENVPSLLSSADIFVLTSLYEGMPNSILEAMSQGLPVVSTKVNGVVELIENGVNGFTISAGDVDEIYKSLNELVADKSKRLDFGQKAKAFVESGFSVDRMVRDLDEVLKSN